MPRRLQETATGLDTTAGRVLDTLRQGAGTVDEVATALGMTATGARLHLNNLQRDGLVRLAGQRAGTRKPFNEYALTPLGEQALSRAYLPVLRALVDTMGDQFTAEQSRQLFARVGERLAREMPRSRPGTSTASGAAAVLHRLGGSVRASTSGGLVRLDGHGCPLAELVRACPITCEAVRSLLEEVLSTPVRQCCSHGPNPACGFEFGEEER
jgi:DeoR family transcriptional regulator, suf operon transcriptional repressor